MNKLDYKKEFKDLYQPKTKPSLVDVPEMTFISVRGLSLIHISEPTRQYS